MSKHLFGMILTHQGTYANNRGENEGNATTLQKILRNGDLYTTVSAEAIRYALRVGWQTRSLPVNRTFQDHRKSEIAHKDFENWHEFIDDDVLGFMHAREETLSRRGALEITRAVSTTPWRGETMRNFAGTGSNPVGEGKDPIPYAVEVHDTRYQFGFAMTPWFLGRKDNDSESKSELTDEQVLNRVENVLEGLQDLRRVGGNHSRYLCDYSPEAIVLRKTDDPAPRLLYCFGQDEHGAISLGYLLDRVNAGDIDPSELVIGTALDIAELRVSPAADSNLAAQGGEAVQSPKRPPFKTLADAKVTIVRGVKTAVKEFMGRMRK